MLMSCLPEKVQSCLCLCNRMNQTIHNVMDPFVQKAQEKAGSFWQKHGDCVRFVTASIAGSLLAGATIVSGVAISLLATAAIASACPVAAAVFLGVVVTLGASLACTSRVCDLVERCMSKG